MGSCDYSNESPRSIQSWKFLTALEFFSVELVESYRRDVTILSEVLDNESTSSLIHNVPFKSKHLLHTNETKSNIKFLQPYSLR